MIPSEGNRDEASHTSLPASNINKNNSEITADNSQNHVEVKVIEMVTSDQNFSDTLHERKRVDSDYENLENGKNLLIV